MKAKFAVAGLSLLIAIGGCAGRNASASSDDHADHAMDAMAAAPAAQDKGLPADAAGAVARLNASPRHGEYQMLKMSDGDSVKVWVVYPQRSTKAPVVLVVHEIFGLTNWVRGVADQLAAEGFIAIAPDLLTSKNIPADSAGDPVQQQATSAIRTLAVPTVQAHLREIGAWGMKLPAATNKYGIVGFCWGGGTSFDHAISSAALNASVVYYGTPSLKDLSAVKAPVLGLYGGADARIGATIPATDSAMKALHKTYEPHSFENAGHGFARQQTGQNGANAAAIRQAWPLTVQWFHKYLGS
jgi:carboxymethylenebutenolidase